MTKKAKAVRYRGTFLAALDHKKEGKEQTQIHRVADWKEALPYAAPVIVVVVDEITAKTESKGEGRIFNIESARKLAIDLIIELANSGDAVAQQMKEIMDDLLDMDQDPDPLKED